MKHKTRSILVVSLLICIVFLNSACNRSSTAVPETADAVPSATSTATHSGSTRSSGDTITALGTVRPAQTLQLSFGTSAPIQTVHARLGTQVKAGELLAELDTAELELDLQNAQQEVAFWQAALDGLLDGADAALVKRAETEHAQQVARAQVALEIAQLQLQQAQAQDPASAVTIAQSALTQLDLQLAQARAASPDAQVTSAQIALTRAQDALQDAQVEYSKALDRPWEPQDIRDALAKNVRYAEQEVQLAQAQLAYAQSVQRAHALGIDLYAAQKPAAQAQLAQAVDAQAAYSVTLQLWQAQVKMAELDLEELQAWENPHLDPAPSADIAQTQARLRQAELAVARLELHLEHTQIVAPFDSVISAVYARAGEWATLGMPIIEVIDTTRWHV